MVRYSTASTLWKITQFW